MNSTLFRMFLLLCEAKEIAEASWARVNPQQARRDKVRRLIAYDRRHPIQFTGERNV